MSLGNSESDKNSAPVHHLEFDTTQSALSPRERKSAGFSLPAQWYHEWGSVRLVILLTQQQIVSIRFTIFFTLDARRAATTAPSNSSLGRVTRLFEVTSVTEIPFLDFVLKYMAAPYAFLLASQKLCNSTSSSSKVQSKTS
ncbi:hypothetical protein TNCV_1259131 [Trichonephila clavipes]|nr:hypothetical protein TNCV_1259131 [Trichonephila clavipes]